MTHHRGGIRHSFNYRRPTVIEVSDCPDYIVINGRRVCLDTGLDTGALKSGEQEKTNPLPAGRYWVDVFGKNIPIADNWFKAFASLGVNVETTQQFKPTPQEVILEKGPFPSQDDIQSMVRNWYLFTYTPINGVPVEWDQKTFGYPTVAGPEIKSSDDTAQKPDLPLDPLNNLEDFLDGLAKDLGITSKAGAIALTAGAFIGGGYLLFELFKEKRRGRKSK